MSNNLVQRGPNVPHCHCQREANFRELAAIFNHASFSEAAKSQPKVFSVMHPKEIFSGMSIALSWSRLIFKVCRLLSDGTAGVAVLWMHLAAAPNKTPADFSPPIFATARFG